METKDYVYLAVLVVSALALHLHGYRLGVQRTRRLFKRLLRNPEIFTAVPPPAKGTAASCRVTLPGRTTRVPVSTAAGVFRNN